MQGSFTVGLLKIVAYLIPGVLALGTAINTYSPAVSTVVQRDFWSQIAFLGVAYIVGHILAALSAGVLRIREHMRVFQPLPQQKRLSFFGDLRAGLPAVAGINIWRREEYILLLRVLADKWPRTSQEVKRLYALTLFCRNMAVALFVVALLVVGVNLTGAAVPLLLSVVFLYRYVQIERDLTETAFQAAYVLLHSGELPSFELAKRETVAPETVAHA